MTDREREVVFEIAASRGVGPGSPAHAQLEAWLLERPPNALFETALEVMKAGLALLTPEERDDRTRGIVEACSRVADASGGGLAKLLGMGSGVSGEEMAVIDAITMKLRAGSGSHG